MSSGSPGVVEPTQRRSSPRRRASSQSSMPRPSYSAVHASVMFVAGQGASGWRVESCAVESLITTVRTLLILVMAAGQSPARNAISASTSRISRPVERLIGETRAVYFVGKSQGTYLYSAVGMRELGDHATPGAPKC